MGLGKLHESMYTRIEIKSFIARGAYVHNIIHRSKPYLYTLLLPHTNKLLLHIIVGVGIELLVLYYTDGVESTYVCTLITQRRL